MTLDEAIIHCEEAVAEMRKKGGCDGCADEHQQLADWLKELKEFRERESKMTDEELKNKCSEISGTPFDYFKAGYELAKSVDNKE